MDTSVFADEMRAEAEKIRTAYPWLEEATIERFAEQTIKNRHHED